MQGENAKIKPQMQNVILAQVVLRPAGGIVSVQGGVARFFCSADTITITGVQWLLNGTALQDLNLSNVNTVFSNDAGIQTGLLAFTNLPLEYNMTCIVCIANTSSGVIESNNVSLVIQGLMIVRHRYS